MTQFLLFDESSIPEKSLEEKRKECLDSLRTLYPKVELQTLEEAMVFAGFPMWRDIEFRDAFFSRVRHYIKNLFPKKLSMEKINRLNTPFDIYSRTKERLIKTNTNFKIKFKTR